MTLKEPSLRQILGLFLENLPHLLLLASADSLWERIFRGQQVTQGPMAPDSGSDLACLYAVHIASQEQARTEGAHQ